EPPRCQTKPLTGRDFGSRSNAAGSVVPPPWEGGGWVRGEVRRGAFQLPGTLRRSVYRSGHGRRAFGAPLLARRAGEGGRQPGALGARWGGARRGGGRADSGAAAVIGTSARSPFRRPARRARHRGPGPPPPRRARRRPPWGGGGAGPEAAGAGRPPHLGEP